MTSILNIETNICVEPYYFNSNIYTHIFDKIKNNLEDTCTKEYGYILEVKKLIKIKDNYISSNCEHIFIVCIEILNLKPEIGKEFEGIICMIFSEGIFINIKDKLKVLVPVSYIKDYKYNQDKNIFINNNNENDFFKQNDKVNVIISGIKYSKQNFSCFGNIKNKY